MLKKRIFSKLLLRILRYFSTIISIMLVIIVALMKFIELYNERTTNTFDNVISVQELIDAVSLDTETLKSYYIQPEEIYLTEFEEWQSKSFFIAESLHRQFPANYYYHDIYAMLQTYNEDSRRVIERMKDHSTRIYAKSEISKLESLSRYISDEAHKTMATQLIAARESTATASGQIRTATVSSYAIICLVTLLCILFAYRFSRHISLPIISLVNKFRLVADGNMRVREPEIAANDEVNVLIRSFNHMAQQHCRARGHRAGVFHK